MFGHISWAPRLRLPHLGQAGQTRYSGGGDPGRLHQEPGRPL